MVYVLVYGARMEYTHYIAANLESRGGKYRAALKYIDEDGARRKTTKALKATGKRAAQRELEEWRAAMEAEWNQRQREGAALAVLGFEPETVLTVAAYVRRYIDGKRPSIDPSTFNEYGRLLDNIISPLLGEVALSDLNPDMVRAWVAKMGETYAPGTMKKALTLLRSACNQAVDTDLLGKDPTRGVKPPKAGRPRPNSLTAEGVRTVREVLRVAGMTPAMLGVKIALYTGMREGEICGLRWANVDIDSGVLKVEDSIGRDGTRFYAKDPKNDGSARAVYFGSELAADLVARREEMEAACRAAGVPFTGALYVLGDIRGGFMRPNTIWQRWRNLAEALELKGTRGTRPTFHDLRHTFATMAVAAHVDIKAISASMGHSNAAMTLNIYADATAEGKQRAAQTMQAVLSGGEA